MTTEPTPSPTREAFPWTPDDLRADLKAVFDTPGLLDWMAKAVKQGAMPMEFDTGRMIPWSDWLVAKIEARAVLRTQGDLS
jgi:hypothetical protein